MRGALLVLVVLSSSGCFRIHYRTRRPAGGVEQTYSLNYRLLGVNDPGRPPISVNRFCPNGFSRVSSVKTFLDSLAELRAAPYLTAYMECAADGATSEAPASGP